MSSQCQWNIM
uniref:Uncharacterized protein n=1 Tax=Anguilla anguilla TaxID=7936 RepID=A0A0E9TFT8_ANGAN